MQNPVLSLVHPTIGLGLIGTPVTPGAAPTSPDISMLPSLVDGIRLARPRPDDRGVYVEFFGGPGVALAGSSVQLGAEAGTALGYRWHWLDVSTGLGYAYVPGRGPGLE